MNRKLIIYFLLFWGAGAFASPLSFNGYVRNSVWSLYETGDFALVQNTFDLKFLYSKSKARFKVNPVLYYYQNQDPESDRLEILFREAYLDLFFPSLDIRAGKQQIVWGKADGVFITDVVSPKDLRKFILPDFEEVRIGVTALKVDYYAGNSTFELVWLPVFTPNRLPEEGSIWKKTPDFPITPAYDYTQKDVDEKLENSEVFLKYSVITSLADLEIMGGYTWDDDPAFHQNRIFTGATLTSLTLTPKHHRLGLFGGSFSSTVLEGWVVRGEAAYYLNKHFATGDPNVKDGVTEKNYLHYLIGIDFSLFGADMSIQAVQEWIQDYDNYLNQDEFDTTFTFLIKNQYLNDTLTLEIFSYFGLNPKDALIRPKITYSVSDGFDASLGTNFFIGDKEGRFGQFKGNSMIYTQLKYSF